MDTIVDLVIRPFTFDGRNYEQGDRITVSEPRRRDQLLRQRQTRRIEGGENPPLSVADQAIAMGGIKQPAARPQPEPEPATAIAQSTE